MSKQSRHPGGVSRSNDVPVVAADFVYDATAELVGRRFKEGLNPIMRSGSGLELMVRATPGEPIEYLVLDRDGRPVDESISVTLTARDQVTNDSTTTCWKCGKDASGNTHCWVIPCPVIVGPWTPGHVMKEGIRFLAE